jgi:hypothetical protein
MNFALWLEKKDIELYESILNEMERRDFLKAGLAGLAGLAGSKAEAGSEVETGSEAESSMKKEISKKPMTASLQNDSPNGMFSITIENAKGKKTHAIQFLIKQQIEKFLNTRQLKLKDPYINIDVYSYLTNKTKDDVHEKFTTMKDLILSNPHGSSSNKLEAFLMNNKNAYDDDSLTFVFKYTEKKPNGKGNPLQNPLRK